MGDKSAFPFWGRKTLMIVTGASKGIGKNFAIEFSRLLKPNSTVLLLARSIQYLEETKNSIVSLNYSHNVKIHQIDLSDPNVLEYRTLLSQYANDQYELSFLVHNAASIICDVLSSKMYDAQIWNKYMSLNLYSVTALTSVFLELFTSGERCLLNVTSLAAVQPMKSLGYYCVGKASREMYFRMLAEEDPSLNILSYSPGPVTTSMFMEIAEKSVDADMKSLFENMRATNTAVKMEDTTKKVIDTLRNRGYKSADRVDFYDRCNS